MFRKLTTALLASLALALPLALTTRANAEAPELASPAYAPHWVVFGYPPGDPDEQIFGRYRTRSHAEDAADRAANQGWRGIRLHFVRN